MFALMILLHIGITDIVKRHSSINVVTYIKLVQAKFIHTFPIFLSKNDALR